jgi:hypothetical protein
MKDTHPHTPAGTQDDAEPWVREGLRALREQAPSDESRRATLAQLGIADEAALPATAAHAPDTGRALLRWLVGGALLGVLHGCYSAGSSEPQPGRPGRWPLSDPPLSA